MITRRFALTALPFAAFTATMANTAHAHDDALLRVGGLYTAYGMNADGSKYQGQVEVSQFGTTVELYWKVGNQQYSGRGVLQGSVMTVDWGASTPVIYVVVGIELHGTWDGGSALERLVPR
ncbi:MAG: hypothetical protein AAGL23_17935 [Pseudomonadota bacterium]